MSLLAGLCFQELLLSPWRSLLLLWPILPWRSLILPPAESSLCISKNSDLRVRPGFKWGLGLLQAVCELRPVNYPLYALFSLDFVGFQQLLWVHWCYPPPLLCSWWPSGFANCSVFSVSGMEWGRPSKVAVVPLAAWLYSSCAFHSGLFPLILCRVSLIGHQSASGSSESSISLDPISWGWWWHHGGNMATKGSECAIEVSSWTLG